jgi:hypothetical protein
MPFLMPVNVAVNVAAERRVVPLVVTAPAVVLLPNFTSKPGIKHLVGMV